MAGKSFYELHFSIEPGGSRKDAHYIRGSLAEIKADLATELKRAHSLYLLCSCGATLDLNVYQGGKRAASFDLHPLLAISIKGYPKITFTGPNQPVGYDFTTDEEAEADDVEEAPDPAARRCGRRGG